MKIEYYCRRQGSKQFCEVEKTTNGWEITTIGLEGGSCDKTGKPYLFSTLNHDSVNYPEALGGYMDYLWRQAEENEMRVSEIQGHLNTLGDWISVVEENSPEEIFELFK